MNENQLDVLFITRKWKPTRGGMETYSINLVEALSDRVRLTLLHPPEIRGAGRSIKHLFAFFFSSAAAIVRGRRRHDVIHLGDLVLWPLALLARLSGYRGRIVVTVHGLDIIYGDRTGVAPALYRLFMTLVRRVSVVDAYVSNSENTARIARERGLGPVYPVPLGCTPDLDSPLPCPDPASRSVLFLGRLVRRKGADWFAREVLPLLPDDVRFVVVGSPWDDDVVAALEDDPRVDLRGEVDDDELDRLVRCAWVGVMPNLPSEHAGDVEGFGLVALDFARRGVPLVAADLEGITDAVADAQTGFLVAPGDGRAFAARVSDVLSWSPGQRAAFAVDARRMTAFLYSWRRVADDTLSIYRRTAQ